MAYHGQGMCYRTQSKSPRFPSRGESTKREEKDPKDLGRANGHDAVWESNAACSDRVIPYDPHLRESRSKRSLSFDDSGLDVSQRFVDLVQSSAHLRAMSQAELQSVAVIVNETLPLGKRIEVWNKNKDALRRSLEDVFCFPRYAFDTLSPETLS